VKRTIRACRLPISTQQRKKKIRKSKEYRFMWFLALFALILNSLLLLLVLGIGLYHVRYLLACGFWLSVFVLLEQRVRQVNSHSVRQILIQELVEDRQN
jgi:hypothetical protein